MPITGQTLLPNIYTLLPDNGADSRAHNEAVVTVSIPATLEWRVLTHVFIYLYFILLISKVDLQISIDFSIHRGILLPVPVSPI